MKPSALRKYVLATFFSCLFIIVVVRFNAILGHSPRPLRFVKVTLPLLVACIGVNVIMLYLFSRRQRRLALSVLDSIRKGDLKARFPVRSMDEIGQLYQHFNLMAEEIERLVGRLREAETARTQMLRELSHDVRTPLTSMRFIVETFHDRSDGVTPAELHEGSGVILEELSYFQRLIEDLFLLAQLDEPNYRADSSTISLRKVFEEEAAKFPRERVTVSVHATAAEIFGDAQMLRRLARNLLDNAFHFAKSKVDVFVERQDGLVLVRVVDDGPGFSADAASAFGKRKPTRLLEAGSTKRVSLGLGSVIVRNVAEAHRGALAVSNWNLPDGSVGGAEIVVRFPDGAHQLTPKLIPMR